VDELSSLIQKKKKMKKKKETLTGREVNDHRTIKKAGGTLQAPCKRENITLVKVKQEKRRGGHVTADMKKKKKGALLGQGGEPR